MNTNKTGIWALLAKFGAKFLSIFIKLLKGAKFLKFGLAAASFAGYAFLFTWKFAILILIALAFHEQGHVWAMKRMGIKTKGFYFIPFLGGAAIAEERYKTYGQNSYISIMGPIWGAILAAISGVVYCFTGEPMFAAAACWMAVLNLFNLFPISPLDGGQLIKAIAFSLHKNVGVAFLFLSLIGAIFLMYKLHIGLFALFIIVGAIDLGIEVYRRRKNQVRYHPAAMNKMQLVGTIAAYTLTIGVLVLIVKLTQHIPGADIAANFLADK